MVHKDLFLTPEMLIRGIDTPAPEVYTPFKMQKALRSVLSLILLSGLALSQLPAAGNCQMSDGSYFAKGCPMPCCKAKLPMPRCPFLKVSAPRDVISTSAPTLSSALQPLHAAGLIQLPALRPMSATLTRFIQNFVSFFSGPPPNVRAPPSSSYLQDA